jgi:acetolactate synthase-1/2/3 large subunit
MEAGLQFLFKDDKAALIEVMIPADEKVFPMIPAGLSQKEMIEFKDHLKMKK